MTITKILTNADGSAGRDKTDVRPAANLDTMTSAAEWNNVKNAVIGLTAEVGLSDGSTGGSVLEAHRFALKPKGTAFGCGDDFLGPLVEYTDSTSNGTVSRAHPNIANAGAGVITLTATDAASAHAEIKAASQYITGGQLPVFEARFRTPAAFANCDFWIGMGDGTNSYARLRCDATATPTLQTRSATGGNTGSTAAANALTAATWYTIKIAVSASAVTLYIDGAIAAIVQTSGAIPTGDADPMEPILARIERNASGPHAIHIDWWTVTGVRR